MLRPLTPARSLVFLTCVSCLLIFMLVPRYDLLGTSESHQIAPRDLINIPGPGGDGSGSTSGGQSSSTATSTSTTAQTSSTTAQTSSTAAATTSSTTATPAQTPSQTQPSATSNTNTTPQSTSASPTSTSPPSGPSSPTNTNTPPPANTPPASPILSSSVSINNEGQAITVVVTVPASAISSSSPSTSPTAGADQSDGDSSKGVGTSTIIGLSVAGGVAFIGIISFVIWKFTRKRFSDDFDDGEAIKWPELNAHSGDPHALPTQRADNAGFETSSQVNLTRPDSRAGSFAPSAATSAVDLYAPNAAQDPYAVPPLPHLNPNQPYRDDPAGGFYDPYSGPIPQTFSDGDSTSIPGGEAIPMTQINRSRSPAPMGYDAGRMSPGPQMVYDAGRRSPGPQAAYLTDQTGRGSPSPRATSPGPAMSLSGRASPGPQATYGYGGGAPPGLHPGY